MAGMYPTDYHGCRLSALANGNERVVFGVRIIKGVHITQGINLFFLASFSIAFLWLASIAFAFRKMTLICRRMLKCRWIFLKAIHATLHHGILVVGCVHVVSIHVVGVMGWSKLHSVLLARRILHLVRH